MHRFLELWGRQVAILGGLLWTGSWLLNVSLTDSSGEGTRLGFTEGNARSILNPAILLIIIGVLAFQRVGAAVMAPVARLLGYRARYEKYSGGAARVDITQRR